MTGPILNLWLTIQPHPPSQHALDADISILCSPEDRLVNLLALLGRPFVPPHSSNYSSFFHCQALHADKSQRHGDVTHPKERGTYFQLSIFLAIMRSIFPFKLPLCAQRRAKNSHSSPSRVETLPQEQLSEETAFLY